ncbi:MAG TPA: CPBP family intramembrane glutamic endopeptidase [Polyangiaceae bacterium]|nr:CPBP family intramembrane glutamic endopeptidase [Polyangiaceae bacterium]
MSPPAIRPEPSPDATRANARRGLLWFGLGVLLVSAPLEAWLLRSPGPLEAQPRLVFALVAVPGAVSVLVRLARREGFADLSLRVGNRRALAIAWLLPAAALALAYGLAWAAGLERFEMPPGAPPSMGVAATFAASFAFALVQGTVFGSLGAAAEELGWRGYLLTRLVDAGVKRPVLVSGLAWALWQLPLVLSGRYAPGPSLALSALLFVAGTVAHAYALAKLRLGSGSVWPAIIYRASWAAQLQGTFEAFTRGGLAPPRPSLWTGESGLLVVAAIAALALAYVARPWPLRRSPAERPAGSMSLGDA